MSYSPLLYSAWLLNLLFFFFSERRHVALKLFIDAESMGTEKDDELKVYKCIEASPKDHLGRRAVRSLLDSFDIYGPNGRHRCLVHPPLWETLLDVRHRNSIRRLPSPVIAFVLQRLFQALDFLHTTCHVAHTDIKEGNILFGADDSVLRNFEQEELSQPSPKKELDERTIYLTRNLGTPRKVGAPVLCDLGSSVWLDGGTEHREDIQPNVYRAPEIILDIPWTYSVDIWNVGCMVSTNDTNGHPMANIYSFVYRSGTHSRVSTCSPAKIPSSRHIEAGPTLLK
jgi:serine/threonine-protein kinase SRPK3